MHEVWFWSWVVARVGVSICGTCTQAVSSTCNGRKAGVWCAPHGAASMRLLGSELVEPVAISAKRLGCTCACARALLQDCLCACSMSSKCASAMLMCRGGTRLCGCAQSRCVSGR